MNTPNFSVQYPSLQWSSTEIKDSRQNLFASLASTVRDDRRLLIPPILTTAIIAILSIPTILFRYYNHNLQHQVQQYELKKSQLAILDSGNKAISLELGTIREFLTVDSVFPFLFARLLQNLVPLEVQLKTYSIESNRFFVQASSVSQQSLNDFVSFLSDHPLIDSQSLVIDELVTATISQNPNQPGSMLPNDFQLQTTQPLQVYELKLSGKYKQADLQKLISLARETGASGQLTKLQTVSVEETP